MNYEVINLKVDPATKKEAQRIAEGLGFSLSSILKGYLKQLISTKSMNFTLSEGEPTEAQLTTAEKHALALFKERLQKTFPNDVASLKIFGSKARGDAQKHSDIDVLVVLAQAHSDLATRSRVYQITSDILLQSDIDISPKVLGAADYAKLRSWGEPILLNIEREGITL